jgi:sec-independent protein translocase protein TatB
LFSITHIAIVFLIALLVFGPEKLPEMARMMGRALSEFRKASTDFRRVIEDEFTELERQGREKEEQARRKALEASGATPAQPLSGEPASIPETSTPAEQPGAPGTVPHSAVTEAPGAVAASGEVEHPMTESGVPPTPANVNPS